MTNRRIMEKYERSVMLGLTGSASLWNEICTRESGHTLGHVALLSEPLDVDQTSKLGQAASVPEPSSPRRWNIEARCHAHAPPSCGPRHTFLPRWAPSLVDLLKWVVAYKIKEAQVLAASNCLLFSSKPDSYSSLLTRFEVGFETIGLSKYCDIQTYIDLPVDFGSRWTTKLLEILNWNFKILVLPYFHK